MAIIVSLVVQGKTGMDSVVSPAPMDKYGMLELAHASVLLDSNGMEMLVSPLALLVWSISMVYVLALLAPISATADALSNLTAPQDKHGTVFNAPLSSVPQALPGMALFVPVLPPSPALWELSTTAQDASQTPPLALQALHGMETAAKPLALALSLTISPLTVVSLSHRSALLASNGNLTSAF